MNKPYVTNIIGPKM